jgi:hypothetical protein
LLRITALTAALKLTRRRSLGADDGVGARRLLGVAPKALMTEAAVWSSVCALRFVWSRS